MKKNITLMVRTFRMEYLGKDGFLVPLYLGKTLGYEATIVYLQKGTDKDLPSEVEGVKFKPIKSFHDIGLGLKFYVYLLFHARKIDLLMRFHDSNETLFVSLLYKWLNPKGKAYVKMDLNPFNIDLKYWTKKPFRRSIRKILYKKYLKWVDVFSCETSQAVEMQARFFSLVDKSACEKLVLMPNGFDEDLLQKFNMNILPYSEKENLIITVGRLGSYPKNTEMFVKALGSVDLKNWKVCMIGPIAETFQPVIDKFYTDYPEKKDTVIFTGPIYDRKELWEYYNRAKIFVLTSEYEGCAIVYSEARRFANYIVTTDVGGARDMTDNFQKGSMVEHDNFEQLASILDEIIQGKLNTDVYSRSDMESLSWNEMVKKITPFLR
jgi:putative glycosyltransferase